MITGDGRNCEGLRMAADLGIAARTWAGVGKSPVKEPACSYATNVPQTLWGFGRWRYGIDHRVA